MFSPRETGSEQRSSEFSGLRMRDGEARQGAAPPEPLLLTPAEGSGLLLAAAAVTGSSKQVSTMW